MAAPSSASQAEGVVRASAERKQREKELQERGEKAAAATKLQAVQRGKVQRDPRPPASPAQRKWPPVWNTALW